jgi:hypothetical protein
MPGKTERKSKPLNPDPLLTQQRVDLVPTLDQPCKFTAVITNSGTSKLTTKINRGSMK